MTPDVGPEADSQQKTSLYEMAVREEILNVTKCEGFEIIDFKTWIKYSYAYNLLIKC